jgi:hypothetical protein
MAVKMMHMTIRKKEFQSLKARMTAWKINSGAFAYVKKQRLHDLAARRVQGILAISERAKLCKSLSVWQLKT